ncbi:MAG: inositol-3-phosphate synthase, partial [Desulfobacterales bacterium]
MQRGIGIRTADGKLGVLTPGMGAAATTLVACVYAVRNDSGLPVGSPKQMGTIRLGKRTDKRNPMIRDFVPLSGLGDLVFGGWDIFEDDMYAAAVRAGVLEKNILDGIKNELESVRPMPAVLGQS